MLPSADSLTSTLLGVGGEPGTQLRFEAKGRGETSDGQIVRKLPAVPPTAVTFIATAVASAGMLQRPLAPRTGCVYVSPGLSGVAREPTVSGAGRKSNNLHGEIGTNASLSPVLTRALVAATPPTPS